MDIELIRELFKNCQRAAEILGTDAEFRSELDRAGKRLPPLQIGKRGQLQEWIEDYDEDEPQHRHVSHLYSLYPGHDISLKALPNSRPPQRRASNCAVTAEPDGQRCGGQLFGRGFKTRSTLTTTSKS